MSPRAFVTQVSVPLPCSPVRFTLSFFLLTVTERCSGSGPPTPVPPSPTCWWPACSTLSSLGPGVLSQPWSLARTGLEFYCDSQSRFFRSFINPLLMRWAHARLGAASRHPRGIHTPQSLGEFVFWIPHRRPGTLGSQIEDLLWCISRWSSEDWGHIWLREASAET